MPEIPTEPTAVHSPPDLPEDNAAAPPGPPCDMSHCPVWRRVLVVLVGFVAISIGIYFLADNLFALWNKSRVAGLVLFPLAMIIAIVATWVADHYGKARRRRLIYELGIAFGARITTIEWNQIPLGDYENGSEQFVRWTYAVDGVTCMRSTFLESIPR